MKEMTLDQVKDCELGCLKAAHDFCKEHGLTYYLTFGTLIGAIRHKGFIPWDDDIDILMPRNDYNRFIREFKKTNYRVVCIENDPRCYTSCAKVIDSRTVLKERNGDLEIGAFADVFPMDNLPNNKFRRFLFGKCNYFTLRILRLAMLGWKPGKSFWIRVVSAVMNGVFTHDRIHRWTFGWKYPQKYRNQKNTRYYSLLYHPYPVVPKLEASWFEKPVLTAFEGSMFYVPNGYDAFLRYCYGDYMTLPPVEERYGHHSFTCFWKEAENKDNL